MNRRTTVPVAAAALRKAHSNSLNLPANRMAAGGTPARRVLEKEPDPEAMTS